MKEDKGSKGHRKKRVTEHTRIWSEGRSGFIMQCSKEGAAGGLPRLLWCLADAVRGKIGKKLWFGFHFQKKTQKKNDAFYCMFKKMKKIEIMIWKLKYFALRKTKQCIWYERQTGECNEFLHLMNLVSNKMLRLMNLWILFELVNAIMHASVLISLSLWEWVEEAEHLRKKKTDVKWRRHFAEARFLIHFYP